MLIVISLMIAGVAIGWVMRRRNTGWVRHAITVLIWALLFLLGMEVGGNKRIIESIGSLGLEAVVIAVGATLGSCVAAWGLWRVLMKREQK